MSSRKTYSMLLVFCSYIGRPFIEVRPKPRQGILKPQISTRADDIDVGGKILGSARFKKYQPFMSLKISQNSNILGCL